MFLKLKKHTNIIIILSFLVLSWLSIVLLMNTHELMGTSDLPMHIHQLREVELALHHHNLVYYGINEFHGSAIMTLYPWLNLWPFAILSKLIESKIMIIYSYFALNELIVLIISYFSSLYFCYSRLVSYLFAVFYGLSTLYLDYGFADMDWGELLTMTFFPLVIFGSIALLQKGKWLELSVGMTLIICSHVLNTIMIVVFLMLFLIINIFKINRRMVIGLIKAMLLTTFSTIAVWLPALRIIYLNKNLSTPPEFTLYGTPFKQVLNGALRGDVTYGVSIFALLGVILGALYFLRLSRYTKQLYVISTVIVIICSAWFPWKLAPHVLTMIQFTWRLYLIPEVILSYVCALVIVRMSKPWLWVNILVVAGSLVVALGIQLESQQRLINLNCKAPIINNSFLLKDDKVYGHSGKSSYITTKKTYHSHANIKTPKYYRLRGNPSYNAFFNQREFLATMPHYWPQNALRHYNDINGHYIRSDQGIISHLYLNSYDHFTFTNYRELTNAFLPILMYNGEPVRVILDGHLIKDVNNQNLLFIKRIPKGTHQISFNVEKNKSYVISYWSLIITIISYLMYIIFRIVNNSLRN